MTHREGKLLNENLVVMLYFSGDMKTLVAVDPPELCEAYYQVGKYLVTPGCVQILPGLQTLRPEIMDHDPPEGLPRVDL